MYMYSSWPGMYDCAGCKAWKVVKLDDVSGVGVGRDPGFKLTALLVVSTPIAVTGCRVTVGMKALLEYLIALPRTSCCLVL